MKIWKGIALASALMIGASEAHQDPRGDVHPSVSVMDGTFVVDFISNQSSEEQDSETACRAIWSHDGKLLVPRHRLSETSAELARHPVYEYGTQPHVFFESLEGKGTHRVVLRWPDKKDPRSQPLPMTVKSLDEPYKAETTTIDQGMVAFTWGDTQRPAEDNRVILNLGLVSREEFVEGENIPIGEVATIYSFPRVSNPVWAAKRWWIAWIKKTDAKASYDEPKAFTTMLSSYDPVTKRLTHEPLPGESTWNTTLSLATANGWLCAAWHTGAARNLSEARVVTAFHRLP